jgi:hypothetical protein
MIHRRTLLSALLAASLVVGGGLALAKNQHHHDGHNLLGGKLHQNGKHEVGKAGNASVIAEVKDNKVVSMAAGNLPVQKVKSKKKMAGRAPGIVQASTTGGTQLAQAEAYYYGYCFDTGTDLECYWYPASDVIVTDGWVEFVPA